ncbi:MAG: CBS domain-containing protein [Candidatus Hydrothermarchaeaceae archaeon]
MKLTPVQREVLLSLVHLYNFSKGAAIRGESIAKAVNKNAGTIRNQMQSLRSLGLVEGVPGPKGGYKPTMEGYKILDFEKVEDEVQVPVFINGVLQKDMTISGVKFLSVSDPSKCKVTLSAVGNLRNLKIDDLIKIGPTPATKMVIGGRIIGRDDMSNVLLMDVMELFSIPKEKIKGLSIRCLKTLKPEMSVREVAKFLEREDIGGVPVVRDGEPVGLITLMDITRALASGKEEKKAENIMSKEVYTINENSPLYLAVEEMANYDVDRLIVTDDSGKMNGIITRADILCRIAYLCKPPSF